MLTHVLVVVAVQVVTHPLFAVVVVRGIVEAELDTRVRCQVECKVVAEVVFMVCARRFAYLILCMLVVNGKGLPWCGSANHHGVDDRLNGD